MGGLAKGLAILELFGPGTPSLTLAEAARRTGLSRAAARRCLLTLVEGGFLAQRGRDFAPQPRLLRLGYAYLASVPLHRLAQSVLEKAQAAADEAVSLAVLDGAEVSFVARAAPRRMVNVGPTVGSRLPAWCSATGRVLLAGLPSEQAETRLSTAAFRALTPHTATAPAEVWRRIRDTGAQGFALNEEELELGLLSLAVPVRDLSGSVIAAMSVSSQTGRRDGAGMLRDLLPVLRDAAARLSAAG